MSMHYPVFCYNGQFRRGADGTPLTYMLHGHIHKSEDQVLVDRFSTETRAMMRKSAHQETAQPVPCQIRTVAAYTLPDDQLLLYVFGLHTADAGRVGGV